MRKIRSKLTYPHVVSTLCLFLILGGGAYAATRLHKNSVSSSTIKNGQVKTKDLAKNAVVSSKIKNGQVSSADVRDGSVGSADVAPAEGFHLVGQPGEPSFGNGGQNDCIWSNYSNPGFASPGTLNPVSFYKDPYGRVHLAGFAVATNGPGGDGMCGGTDHDDGFVFVLPPAYRPAHVEALPSASTSVGFFYLGASTDKALSGIPLPAGAVQAAPSGIAVLDGATFRAVGPGNNLSRQATASSRSKAVRPSSGGSLGALQKILK
jgi:hypothetical protein